MSAEFPLHAVRCGEADNLDLKGLTGCVIVLIDENAAYEYRHRTPCRLVHDMDSRLRFVCIGDGIPAGFMAGCDWSEHWVVLQVVEKSSDSNAVTSLLGKHVRIEYEETL